MVEMSAITHQQRLMGTRIQEPPQAPTGEKVCLICGWSGGPKEMLLVDGEKDPVKLRPLPDGTYEPISGHRRLEAIKQLGQDRVWAVVEESDDRQSRLDIGIANLLRDDLNPMDMAKWLKVCMEADPSLTQEKLGKICGHGQAWVAIHLRPLFGPGV
jgi:ParB/RepB/Spo0J family partition protein